MDIENNAKLKIMIIGGLIGALAGVGAAFMLIKRAEAEQSQPRLTPGEGVQLGLGVLGLLRLISGMSGEKK
jgi:hypothetical protein